MVRKRFLIMVAGGTASGKTTVAHKIAELCNSRDGVLFLNIDDYYRDLSHLTLEERRLVNFDHPDALDVNLLTSQLKALIAGKAIEKPNYDFTVYNRLEHTTHIEPAEIIVLDGIFCLVLKQLRALADLKIYVKTDSDLRFIRRLKRDLEERKRTIDSIISQYLRTVKPMHDAFVAPSQRFADLIIPWDFHNQVAVDLISNKINSLLNANAKERRKNNHETNEN